MSQCGLNRPGGGGRVGEGRGGGRDIFFVPCQQFRFSYSLNSCDSLVNVHTGCSLRSCLKITAFFGTKQNKQLRSICCFRLIMSLLLKKTTCKYNPMHRMNWNSWNHSSFEWHNVNLCSILAPPPPPPPSLSLGRGSIIIYSPSPSPLYFIGFPRQIAVTI